MTSNDLGKVKMQCHKPDMIMFWPKSRIMFPFQSVAASYVAENAISVKIGRKLFDDVIAPWPVLNLSIFSPKVAQMMPH